MLFSCAKKAVDWLTPWRVLSVSAKHISFTTCWRGLPLPHLFYPCKQYVIFFEQIPVACPIFISLILSNLHSYQISWENFSFNYPIKENTPRLVNIKYHAGITTTNCFYIKMLFQSQNYHTISAIPFLILHIFSDAQILAQQPCDIRNSILLGIKVDRRPYGSTVPFTHQIYGKETLYLKIFHSTGSAGGFLC